MSRIVLDACALMALVHREPGRERVLEALASGATISAVNLSEVAARLAEGGMATEQAHEVIDPLPLEVVEFDKAQAYEAGALRPVSKPFGLSFGDRACLALAHRLGVPVLSADRAWLGLPLDVAVQLIR